MKTFENLKNRLFKKGLKIPFNRTHMSSLETRAVVKALKSGWLTMGPKTIEFESKFKEFIGTTNAVSTNSATAALHLALKAINIEVNDEVIIPTTTFVTTAEVVTYFGAIPVLCDVEESTHNIDVSKIEDLITPRTKAIIPVHFAGQPCDMDEIFSIAKKYDLKVIEDAAHAIPSKYKGIMIGSLPKSNITCFSFYATKTLSTGEGGMATTNNNGYAKSMKINRLHGISRDAWDRYTLKGSWYYEVVDNGNKYNTTDINSAIGIVQLEKQGKLLAKRKRISQLYNEGFANNHNIILPYIKDDRDSSWHLYVIKVEKRNDLIERLKEVGIGSSVHFIPVHKHPYYRNKYQFENGDYPVANKIFNNSISLPIFPDMTDREIKYVIKKVNEFTNE